MVEFEEIDDETPMVEEIPPSEERLLDAEAIEEAASKMKRLSAKVRLETLAKTLRKESMALKRVEASKAATEAEAGNSSENQNDVSDMNVRQATPAPTPVATTEAARPPPPSAGTKYITVDKFMFDAGSYGSSHVTLYVPLDGVGSIPRENVTCTFTANSLDLIVKDLNGKSYRLFKDNLDKDIIPSESKRIVKANKVIIKLAKVKSEYGSYDYWTDLTAKRKKSEADKKDPTAGLMDMMKDMYESGDDNMKKVIGESMMKARSGETHKDDGGLGDMNF